jgi:hypothetical protein
MRQGLSGLIHPSPVLQVLFLDDDIVVQRDLTRLWEEDLEGNVNGAVETCGASFHRFDKYLNFSNPKIRDNFDPRACGWAYGMNVFDLKVWKEKDITGIYHRWQSQVSRACALFLLSIYALRFLAASIQRVSLGTRLALGRQLGCSLRLPITCLRCFTLGAWNESR